MGEGIFTHAKLWAADICLNMWVILIQLNANLLLSIDKKQEGNFLTEKWQLHSTEVLGLYRNILKILFEDCAAGGLTITEVL